MSYQNNAVIPSIERIMKQPYFDGINQTGTTSNMLECLMEDDCYDYVLLPAKYFDKNSMIFAEDHPLIALWKSGHATEKWLMMYFNMLEKCKMNDPPQDILKQAFDSMDYTVLNEEEREKCKSILKRHLSKNGS